MKYNAKSIQDIVDKINKNLVDMYQSGDIFLPELINFAIIDLWTNEIQLEPADEHMLRRAKKDLDSVGFMKFEDSEGY